MHLYHFHINYSILLFNMQSDSVLLEEFLGINRTNFLFMILSNNFLHDLSESDKLLEKLISH